MGFDLLAVTDAAEKGNGCAVKKILDEMNDPDERLSALKMMINLNAGHRKQDSGLPTLSESHYNYEGEGKLSLTVKTSSELLGHFIYEEVFQAPFPKSTRIAKCE
jgi:hypothetical protein